MPLRPPGHALLPRPRLQACRTPLPPGNPPDTRPVPSPFGPRLQGQPAHAKQTSVGSDRRLPGRTVERNGQHGRDTAAVFTINKQTVNGYLSAHRFVGFIQPKLDFCIMMIILVKKCVLNLIFFTVISIRPPNYWFIYWQFYR